MINQEKKEWQFKLKIAVEDENEVLTGG